MSSKINILGPGFLENGILSLFSMQKKMFADPVFVQVIETVNYQILKYKHFKLRNALKKSSRTNCSNNP